MSVWFVPELNTRNAQVQQCWGGREPGGDGPAQTGAPWDPQNWDIATSSSSSLPGIQ